MKRTILFLAILMNLSCAESSAPESSLRPKARPTYELGDDEAWNQSKTAIKFNDVVSARALFELPQNRPEVLQPENVLASLHTWFEQGVGYEKVQGYTYDYLLLNKIPEKVHKDILTRMGPNMTGFSVLDRNFWKEIQDLQDKGFKFAFITGSPIPIAGFYSRGQNLIAFDIFANSGTVAHEMQHHLDYEKLDEPPFFPKIGKKCRAQFSNFIGEVSATTQQLLHWAKVIENYDFVTRSVAQYENEGERKVTENLIHALRANLEYPTERGNAFAQSKACWNEEFYKVVDNISTLTLEQVDKIIRYDDTHNFSMKFRVDSARALKKSDKVCLQRKQVSDTEECLKTLRKYKEIENEIEKEKMLLAERLVNAYRQRKIEIANMLNQLSKKRFNEACNTVLGFRNMARCPKK